MYKTSDRVSFLKIFISFSGQYDVFVILSAMFVAIFNWHFYCDSFTREENCIQNLCTQIPFGNYWASAMFSGPDFIASLPDRLKIIDPIFITCDDIGKLLFVTSLKHMMQLFGHFNPLSVLLISQKMWHPSSKKKIFSTYKCFFKIR